MRIDTKDLTIVRNYIHNYRFLIKQYELVKAKKHPSFKLLKDFYSAHYIDRRNFQDTTIGINNMGKNKICCLVNEYPDTKQGEHYRLERIK